MGFLNKQQKSRRQTGFQTGIPNMHKGKRRTYTSESTVTNYTRLAQDRFDVRIQEQGELLTFKDTDGTDTSNAPLRPGPAAQTLCDKYTKPLKPRRTGKYVHPDLLTNRLYTPLFVGRMFNSEIRKHLLGPRSKCKGELVIDVDHSGKWGMSWYERLKCSKCKYKSRYYRLFEQAKSKTRGRKSSKCNRNLANGLMTTSSGNVGFNRVLTCMNVPNPALSGMQNQTNQVGNTMVQLNIAKMKQKRQALRAENKAIGQKQPNLVNIEGDSCYNNKQFNSDNTPFQAGTIVATTMVENNTRKKEILGVTVESKLCTVASRLRNSGKYVKCPNHDGPCTATISGSDSIGDEARWNSTVTSEINNDLTIDNYTGDGDSKGHSGVDNGQPTPAKHLKDIRHLSNSMRRQINKVKFSKSMFPPKNRANLQSRFSLSIKARCVAELKRAHAKFNGNIALIKNHMSMIKLVIILCYKGYCGDACSRHSLVCRGDFRIPKNYLPKQFKLRMTQSDESKLMACLNVLLGPKSIDMTRLLTSTQKCEAVNRSYTACLPKSVTFTRNCFGRIHGQVLKLNYGFADSCLMKAEHLGSSFPQGSSVVKHLLQTEKQALKRKSKRSKLKANQSRYAGRMHRYNMHAEVHYATGLTDPKPDFSQAYLADHKYV